MGRTKSHLLILFVHLVLLFPSPAIAFQPVDNFLINCGGNASLKLDDGRSFQPDVSGLPPSVLLSPITNKVVCVDSSDLYKSARIFLEPSEYRFSIRKKGRHFLRLHFYPFDNSRYNLQSAAFSVNANEFTLLHKFSYTNLDAKQAVLVKEYIMEVGFDSKPLTIIFSPSDGSIAFINAMEVISLPDHQFPSIASPVPSGPVVQISTHVALETIYRINVGGNLLDSSNDSLWRVWVPDQPFLINPASAHAISGNPSSIKYPSGIPLEVAPNLVYATAKEMADANVGNQKFNISWVFSVDSGFRYLVRFHFCDFVSKAAHELLFNVYINNQSALSAFDISGQVMGLLTACFMDFFMEVQGETILVQVGPSEMTNVPPNAILNGLEIMKVSDVDDSLDASHFVASVSTEMRNKKKIKVAVVASYLGGTTLLGFIIVACLWYFRRRKKEQQQLSVWSSLPLHLSTNMGNSETKVSAGSFASSGLSLGLGQLLAFAEIREATKNFDESLLLGVGGFGKVYKGVLENGLVVAVKRGNPRSQQGLVEFRTEIEMLSKLRHRHLVSLIGYCYESNEMVLVYEYMAGGPLRKHLYGSDLPALTWKQRLEICIGAAKGLHYLHTGASETIIHRDVKTTNILLDENLTAKVADFGLSKRGPTLDQTHVSTAVKGSFGYLDPQYFRRQQLTEKSDVYSFGVVLMEVLCARPAINPALPREQVNIAEWVMNWQKRGQLKQIIDPHLVGNVSIDSLRKFGETAEKCLAEHGTERPTMGDVLWNLEYALQLQESFMRAIGDENSTNRIPDLPEWIPPMEPIEHESFSIVSADGSDTATTSGLFSQLMDPKGR